MLTAVRKTLRRWVPLPLRKGLARLHRAGRDRRDGTTARLALTRMQRCDARSFVSIEQAIKQSPLWEGKLANLQRGAAMLDGVQIVPGEVFSFWHWIGQPTTARGFAVGRAIRADEATGDPGGGLCQLSGIAYELGLRGGLTIVERHAHSRDLYQGEDERFTPLGLDATVVWPWKDLRLVNRLAVPLCLRFAVSGMTLNASAHAAQPLAASRLDIVREDGTEGRAVRVSRCAADGAITPVSADFYAVDQR